MSLIQDKNRRNSGDFVLMRSKILSIENINSSVQPPLMERAGKAAAKLALNFLNKNYSERKRDSIHYRILVVAGKGNNGGDAFVTARLLIEAGHQVETLFEGKLEKLPKDAARAYLALKSAGGFFNSSWPKDAPVLLIDGLYGSGLSRPLVGEDAKRIEIINSYKCPILSLDVPSGIHSDTGQVMGSAVRATLTVTFIAQKPGLLTNDGPDYAGTVIVDSLDTDLSEFDGRVISVKDFFVALPHRKRNTHKGDFGSALVVGGAAGMVGAAFLAARAALKLGSGKVWIGLVTDGVSIDTQTPELMISHRLEHLLYADAVLVGPGLGTKEYDLIEKCLECPVPLVLDADALNIIAQHPNIAKKLVSRTAPTVLTPHPGEAKRLIGEHNQESNLVLADRIQAACLLAQRFQSYVILKGCGTIIASPEGRWAINSTGNSGLATAGSGDVLAGMLLAFIAQGMPIESACYAAVHLHGAAADLLVSSGKGPIGLTSGELPDAARAILNGWLNSSQALP